jgi:hypothetical protein
MLEILLSVRPDLIAIVSAALRKVNSVSVDEIAPPWFGTKLRHWLQVFFLDVAKIDLDVAYICMLQVFHTYVYKCFIWMLLMFVMVFKCSSGVFVSASSVFFFVCYNCLYMDVSKVDQVLHMGCTWETADGTDDVRGGVGDVRGIVGTLLVH